MKKRMTAIRCEVADIINGTFDNDDGPRVISPYGVEMRRIALLAFVVGHYSSEGFSSITLDDGTGTIRSKGWGTDAQALNSVMPGSFVLVIGKIREYEGERYITPEIVRSVNNPNLMTVHKLERLRTLLKRSGVTGIESPGGEPESAELENASLVVSTTSDNSDSSTASTTEIPSSASLRDQILQFIRAKKKPVSNDEILSYFVERGFQKTEVNSRVLDLVYDGSIIEEPIGVYRC